MNGREFQPLPTPHCKKEKKKLKWEQYYKESIISMIYILCNIWAGCYFGQ